MILLFISIIAGVGLTASACSLIDDVIAQSCRKCIEFTADTQCEIFSAETLYYIQDYGTFGLC